MCDNKDEHSQDDYKETNSPDGNDVSVEKGFVTEDRDGASIKPELKRLPRSQKKRLKQELATQRKKEMRKEKKQLQKQKLKEKAKEEKSKNTSEEGVILPTRKEMREEMKSKLETAMMCGQRICVDLSMENTMTTKERSKLAQQLCRLYGVNKKADVPAHVYFAGFDKNGELYQECIRKIDGFEKYQVEMTAAPVSELFDVKDVIYLTPDAEDMLEELDKDKVYVIGGIVDESIIKNLSKQKANAFNIPTVRLPIDRYMKKKEQIHFSQVLAINQVFEILVTYLSSNDWRAALSRGVPERKGYIMKE
uniref:tRNA methyltransferase 10 homolog B n=1 Tax=Crassostrea virginica TaxID=6565 RepID=A0A8B8DCP1_CRAVI|nr:tRNA methyltransferase 10 homolog B-like [Crassostrea virginica]